MSLSLLWQVKTHLNYRFIPESEGARAGQPRPTCWVLRGGRASPQVFWAASCWHYGREPTLCEKS